MRLLITLSFFFLSTAFFVHAIDPIVVDPDPVPPAVKPVTPDSAGSGTDEPDTPGDTGSSRPLFDPALDPSPDPGEGEEENDIGEKIQSLLDAITSIVSIVQGSSTITSTVSLPSAAYPCLYAESLYNYCSSNDTGFATVPASVQASCLCYQASGNATSWVPGVFDGYLSGCEGFVQAETVYQTASIESAVALCTSLGDVRASAREASASATALSPTAAITQRPSTGGACRRTVLGGLIAVVVIAMGVAAV